MHRTNFLPVPAVACAALACALLPAQTQLSLPTHADAVDGHHKLGLPFGSPGFRTQILVDAAAIASNGAMLNGIAFRAGREAAPQAAQQVPNVTIELSHTSMTLGGMSTAFASNITGTPIAVFQGTVNLPASNPVGAGPAPWDIVITFTAPFVFNTPSGNLLIDITGNNPVGTSNYHLDGVQGGGSSSTFGTTGFNPSGDTLQLRALSAFNNLENNARRYTPGNTVEIVSFLGSTTPPGMLALGLLPQPTPIDLTVIGAPTNFLYIDPIAFAPHTWTQSWLGWHSSFPLALPANPLLIGATVYGQSLILVPAANALGVVFGNAIEVRVGDQAEQLPLQQLDAWDPTAATGFLLDLSTPFTTPAPDYGSTPIRLDGLFF